MLLHDALHGLVDREDQVVAVGRLDVLVVLERHVGADRVLRADHAAGRAGKHVVVLRLEAREALIVRAGEAEHRRGRRAVGIVALVILLQDDAAADFHLVDRRVDLIAQLRLDLALDVDKITLLVRLLEHVVVVEAENLRKAGRDLHVVAGLGVDVIGLERNGPHARALRQNLRAGRVVDRAAHRREDCGLQALVHGARLQLLAAHELPADQVQNHNAEAQKNQYARY